MTDAHTSVNASMPVLENTNALRGTCTDISYHHINEISSFSLCEIQFFDVHVFAIFDLKTEVL